MQEGFSCVKCKLFRCLLDGVHTKLARFKSLTKSGVQEVKDESIRDTLIDLANYAIMTVLEMDDQKLEEKPNECK